MAIQRQLVLPFHVVLGTVRTRTVHYRSRQTSEKKRSAVKDLPASDACLRDFAKAKLPLRTAYLLVDASVPERGLQNEVVANAVNIVCFEFPVAQYHSGQ